MKPEIRLPLNSGFLPIPQIRENIDPGNLSEVKTRLLTILNRQLLILDSGSVQYLNPFSKWISCSPEEALNQLLMAIDGAYQELRLIDASRSIDSLGIKIFDSRYFPFLSPWLWLADFWIKKTTRLGDCPRYSNQETGLWDFVQRKGVKNQTTHLFIRKA